MTKTYQFKYLHIITITFIICLVTSNLAATKLFQIQGFTLPGGIIVFPLLYVLNDILTEVYGFSISRRVIFTALFFNFVVAMILYLVVQLPPADFHSNHEAFSGVFSLAPRVFIASISSYFIGELLNAFTISNLKIMFQGERFAFRAIFSTCVGSFLETFIFAKIAFGAFMDSKTLIGFVTTLTLVKVGYEILLLPITVPFAKFLKKKENTDSYEKPTLGAVFGL